jgi:metal-responsive CopG/Arc/MetJ family transcriptional regulator
MKQKTSITLSPEVLRELDRHAGPGQSRSAYIERVLRSHFRRRDHAAAQARDVERINAAAERLNTEAEDVLEYQTSGSDDG